MKHRRVSSNTPFEAVMGYCRAVRAGDHVYIAGTAPTWPDGHVDPEPEAQARRCFEIIGSALDVLGASFADVVRTRVYLVDARDFDAVFADIRPANTTLVVAALLNPAWKMEIEVDAVVAAGQ
jgi:enamine deaminase RidA (YjgF/YER057c/UK114 family)